MSGSRLIVVVRFSVSQPRVPNPDQQNNSQAMPSLHYHRPPAIAAVLTGLNPKVLDAYKAMVANCKNGGEVCGCSRGSTSCAVWMRTMLCLHMQVLSLCGQQSSFNPSLAMQGVQKNHPLYVGSGEPWCRFTQDAGQSDAWRACVYM